ncbi:MAG TPA: hypothetical protein O0X27_05165 [Methanocorpusculum sp.]|nr:hypothetical protein [Methanocorpusculum sp.]
MTNQYVNNRSLHIGSADVKVALYEDTGATFSTAASIGMLDGVSFKVTGDNTTVETDNAEDIDFGMTNQQAEIAASAWKNIDLEMIYRLTGQMGTLTTTAAGTATTVTGELHVLTGTIAEALKNKTAGTPTLVTSITVKDSTGSTTYVSGTDYTVGLTADGYTTISRITTGDITDGQTVQVGYTYTAAASKKFTYGSTKMPKYLHVWLVNTNADGKKFVIEIYKVSSIQSLELTLGSDKKKDLMTAPVSIIGKPDSTRPSTDDLFSIYDEQGV